MRGVNLNKNGRCTLQVKDVTEVLQKHIEICEKDNITFCLDPRHALSKAASPILTTDNIRTSCEKVKKKVSMFRNIVNVRIENSDGNVESFVGFIQFFF